MTDNQTQQITVRAKTDKYQITYFPDRDEFLLILADPVQVGNVSIEQHFLLDAEIVRQMVEVLPPRDPETVH